MQLPLHVSYHGMPASPALDERIAEHAARLEKAHPSLASCRVGVEPCGHPRPHGRRYAVHVELHAPDRSSVITTRNEHEDVFVAARDAFEAARRRLVDG
ncbi:MAG TPA: HPF/RaiA family ribosome-associated protein [Usitatibacter sp.]|nr:HPF/RaiA family ribosome-associated protein [Usitatibacter sp.]